MNVPDIEHFVRDTLGCRCPDEVFQSVSMRQLPPVGGRLPHTEVLVGSRLLIRVIEVPDGSAADEWFERVVADGRATRDRHGYNRYRLVLVVAGTTATTVDLDDLVARFARALIGDERAHLHLLTADQLPESLRSVRPGAAGSVSAAPAVAMLAK